MYGDGEDDVHAGNSEKETVKTGEGNCDEAKTGEISPNATGMIATEGGEGMVEREGEAAEGTIEERW